MSGAGQHRVLIVDDLAEQRDIHATFLRFQGYEVLEAQDGEEALRMAREHGPDAIVMDVMLPVLDGWAATERLKSDPQTASIPVLLITARASQADRERTLSAGADAYLSKPCGPRDVLREIQRLMQPNSAALLP